MNRLKRIVLRIWQVARDHPIALITWVTILVGWEIAAHIVPESTIEQAPLVPSWEYVFNNSLLALSGGWTRDFWAPVPQTGGEATYFGAFLALADHTQATVVRLVFGLFFGVIAGVATGLAVSYFAWLRVMAWAPLNLLRMFPLLAAIPLFQFWLGGTLTGTTVFIGFGVWVLLVVATINSVANVPDRYIESARTLGASRFRTYRSIVVPASIPELRIGLMLAAGLSWSLTVGAEYIGATKGLGNILAVAEFTTNTGRMMIIAVVISVAALSTFFILNSMFNRLVQWMPKAPASARFDRVTPAAGSLGGALNE